MKTTFVNQRAIIFASIMSLMILSWFIANANVSAQAKLPKPSGHVNDFGEVLDAQTKDRLEKILENFKQRTEIDFVIVTVKSAGAEDLYQYSLRIANDWNVGVATSPKKSVLLAIASDKGDFLAHFSRGTRTGLPDGLIGDMSQRMHAKINSGGYSEGVLTGVKIFINGLGERNNFTFADLDAPPNKDLPNRDLPNKDLIAEQRRPRTVESPAARVAEKPTETPLPQPTETPKAEATAAASVPSPQTAATAEVNATPPATPSAEPSETPASSAPSATPAPVSSPSESPAPAEKTATPNASPTAQSANVSSPTPSVEIASDANRTSRSPNSDRKVPGSPTSPDDEKEAVEVTLALPPDKRIETLKAFIAAHPQSLAVPRANELIVVAHALLGDQKLQTGDVNGGLQQFRLAISDAPAEMPDRLFTEVIARIPANLFLRRQRAAALDSARQAEALAKQNPKRLAAVAGFYLLIEDVNEAGRLGELAVAAGPDSAVAHQALGEARHIALRLDDAENEFARAHALDPKWASPRIALADLKRSAGKFDEALALYREQLQLDPKNNAAHAGVVVALLELGKNTEAEAELSAALKDPEQARNLQMLVGAAYWFVAHDSVRGFELANVAANLEPRYAWGQIALARALIASNRPQEAERSLRFARQYSRFPTLDYEMANMLASIGLFDDAAAELAHSFTLKNGQIETMLAGRNAAHAASFIELLGPERRAVIFQSKPADTDANAGRLKALLALNTALNQPPGSVPGEDELVAMAKDFTAGDDAMRTFRQIYVAEKFLSKNVALPAVIDLMDQATSGVQAALSAPAATLAVQPEEYGDIRARALAQGGTPSIPDAPRAALSGLLRGRIEDLAGVAFFKLDKANEAVTRLRRAVNSSPEGTPLWRSALWHLGGALEAMGTNDQALLYYIKSYLAGPPDPARRSVIENVYKKVNRSLDGLDDKIGPGFTKASSSPTPQD